MPVGRRLQKVTKVKVLVPGAKVEVVKVLVLVVMVFVVVAFKREEWD